MIVSGERFTAGQRVDVEIAGRPVSCVFVRYAAAQASANVKDAGPRAGHAAVEVGWVRRSDTGEVEPFDVQLISGG